MGRVGPVIMAHPVARSCLESSGVVFSFRTSDRTTGETHYRYERTGTKQGDVVITQVSDETLPTHDALEPYRHLSGFSTTTEWREAITDMHGGTETPGYIYRVELV